MKCIHCQVEIYWSDSLGSWFHVNNEELCRATFATPKESDRECVCGHSREYHALREDVYSCFHSDCKCLDFVTKVQHD